MDVRSALGGFTGPTWVVNGPNTWDAAGGCVPERARTDGLVAAGDCVAQLRSAKGLVTSSGSTPGLVVRTSADPITKLKKSQLVKLLEDGPVVI